jgi:hypothetical protein
MKQDELPDEELKALAAAKPSWLTDGKGVSGDVVKVSNTKSPLQFESKVVYRRPELNAE